MQTIRISKEFTFEMAHALYGHKGDCKNIHGHSYKLTITLKGKPIQQEGHSSNGMVMDFSDLKKIVNENIINEFDHALALNANSPQADIDLKGIANKLILLPYQPTCENMLIDFSERINKKLPDGIKLHSMLLRETATSFAEWNCEDNEVGYH
jgi:6-pyruvoyltetrahydropterin/6-carboxytetrahydropterin synthase